MHDDKIAKNAIEYTMSIVIFLDLLTKDKNNPDIPPQKLSIIKKKHFGTMRDGINQFMGTHVFEIIPNQKDPSIIRLTVEIINLLNNNNFFNNFKPNEIGDRIKKIQDYIIKQFPYIMDGLDFTIIDRD